jgi:hypothetical protein
MFQPPRYTLTIFLNSGSIQRISIQNEDEEDKWRKIIFNMYLDKRIFRVSWDKRK